MKDFPIGRANGVVVTAEPSAEPSAAAERAGALREMGRVAARSGTVAVLVPASRDAQPVYGPFVDMAARHAGPEARSLLNTYLAEFTTAGGALEAPFEVHVVAARRL
jgi:hypothetical protein